MREQLAYSDKVTREIQDELLKSQIKLGWLDGVPPYARDKFVKWVPE